LPKPKTQTKEGIVLPDAIGTEYVYGRVISTGPEVSRATVGEIAIFDQMGARRLELDPHKETGLVVIEEEQVFGTINPSMLNDLNLPVPE